MPVLPPVTDAAVLVFTGLRAGRPDVEVFALEADGDIVTLFTPPDRVYFEGGVQELSTIGLDAAIFAEFNGALHFVWSDIWFENNFFSHNDTHLTRLNRDGTLEDVLEVRDATYVQSGGLTGGFERHAMTVYDGDLLLPLGLKGDPVGQYFAVGDQYQAQQITAFNRPGAPGVLHSPEVLGDEVYFVADIQSPLFDTDEVWRLTGAGQTQLVYDGSLGGVRALTSFGGQVWYVADDGYRLPSLFRVAEGGAPIAVPLDPSIDLATEFEVLDGNLHLRTDQGLYRIDPNGTVSADLAPTLGRIFDVVSFNDTLYFSADGLGLNTQLFRLDPDGGASLVHRMPDTLDAQIAAMTVVGDALYFTAETMIDDGFGGLTWGGRQLFRMTSDETVTRLTDASFLGVGTLFPYQTDDISVFSGTSGSDILQGSIGADTIFGGDGADTLIGNAGDDFLFGGSSLADLRDVIFGGDGNDSLDGGWGNDDLNGGNGHDTVLGDFGADTVIGNAGNDLIGGGAGADLMFGNAGNDTLNGGFGFDRLNGGAGADSFFHAGVAGHGSDWVQDFNSAEGDVLTVGLAGATRAQFQVNISTTPGAGSATVAEAFVIYRPTGQVLWALVDGGDDAVINANIGGAIFDLTA